MGARPSSFKQSRAAVAAPQVDVTPARKWSAQQQAIFTWFEKGYITGEGTRNLLVRARAGTGKTTTIIEGINRAPEQDIMLCAFAKKIADELNNRLKNPHATASTMHSIGYKAVRQAWGYIKIDEVARRNYLTDQVTKKDDPRQIKNLIGHLHVKAREVIGKVKGVTVNDIVQLAIRFDLTPDDEWVDWPVEAVAERALLAMQFAANETKPPRHIGIDYADQIFLPLVKGWLTARHDLVVVDEAQDFNPPNLEMAKRICRPGGRICIVGDNKQAIFAFRGADSKSLDHLKKELNAVELPLTVTYRCCKNIVDYVKRYLVPDFEAGPDNPVGVILEEFTDTIYENAKPADFILSRTNAPLVSHTLAFLRRGIRARMQGRDVGRDLAAIIEHKLKCNSHTPVPEMLDKLQAYVSRTSTNLASYGRQDKIQMLQDKAETIEALSEDHETVGDVLQACNYLFEDGKREDTVILSTVHKAKGLETDTVFVLKDTLYRRGRSEEEEHIEYVAVTRGKTTLRWISDAWER